MVSVSWRCCDALQGSAEGPRMPRPPSPDNNILFTMADQKSRYGTKVTVARKQDICGCTVVFKSLLINSVQKEKIREIFFVTGGCVLCFDDVIGDLTENGKIALHCFIGKIGKDIKLTHIVFRAK